MDKKYNFQNKAIYNEQTLKCRMIDKSIGMIIAQKRQEKNMSQKLLAEHIGVTSQQLQKYEKAKNRITASRLFLIPQILDIEMKAFFKNIETEFRV